MRIAVGIEYDGSHYHGWQTQQPGVNCVQENLEQALSFVANEPVSLVCAGRTDTGVHATQQIAHFDTTSARSSKAWVFGANTRLPRNLGVLWACPVTDDFHARFSATARRYRYLIYNDPVRPALFSHQLTWNYRPLDAELMQQAGNRLVGTHDFTSFRAVGCQAKSPVRTIHFLTVTRTGPLVVIDIKANAFLQHMVRNIAGVLMAIGSGKYPVEWIDQVLAARDRSEGGVTAPPHGLYFVDVEYPDFPDLPKREPGPHFLQAIAGKYSDQPPKRPRI